MADNVKFETKKDESKQGQINLETLDKKSCIEIILKQQRIVDELQNHLTKMNLDNMFTRLEFLFRAVSFSDDFPTDFIQDCKDEIVELMTIKPKNNDKNETEK